MSSDPGYISTDGSTNPGRIRTLVADDSPIALDSLCRFLDAQPAIAVVGTALGGQAAIELTRTLRPQLLLVDLQMPGLNGLQVTEIVTKEIPGTQVIIISVQDSPAWFPLSRTAGARAFVSKNRLHDQLLSAIQIAFTGASIATPATTAEKPPTASWSGHGECILVVDDEASIRKLATKALEAHGYQALTAEDGTEALTLFLQHRDKIKVVLTDLVMPFMDGLALIRALKKVEPQVRVVACTGMARETGPHNSLSELSALGVGTFLSKPYKAIELLQMLRETIDAPRENLSRHPDAEG